MNDKNKKNIYKWIYSGIFEFIQKAALSLIQERYLQKVNNF